MGASQNCFQKSKESNQEIIQSQIVPTVVISKHQCEIREQLIEFNYMKPKQQDDDQCLRSIIRNYYRLEHDGLKRIHRQYKQNQSVLTTRPKKHVKQQQKFDLHTHDQNMGKSTQFKTDPSKRRRSLDNESTRQLKLKPYLGCRKSFTHFSNSIQFGGTYTKQLEDINYQII